MKKQLLWLMAACSVLLAGCTQVIDLTEEEEDIIAEYAVGELMYQYKISKGLIEVEPPTLPTEAATEEATQEETTAAEPETQEVETIPMIVKKDETETTAPDGNPTDPTDANGETTAADGPEDNVHASSNIGSDVGMASLMEALQVSGVELSVLGYTVEDRYPTEEYALSVEADGKHKLLVVEYDVWNSEDTNAVMEINPDNATIKATINGTENVNIYRTILKSDLSNMNGMEFEPGEAKVGVLIFRISDELAENITSVQVKATAK
ncbi:MAG: hypothetical protein NC086_10160 [Alistipes sp.]|nr:hypothetical protein [Alistipes sp.]